MKTVLSTFTHPLNRTSTLTSKAATLTTLTTLQLTALPIRLPLRRKRTQPLPRILTPHQPIPPPLITQLIRPLHTRRLPRLPNRTPTHNHRVRTDIRHFLRQLHRLIHNRLGARRDGINEMVLQRFFSREEPPRQRDFVGDRQRSVAEETREAAGAGVDAAERFREAEGGCG